MRRACVLVLGGARSGKSRFAQEIASRMGGPVLFVATAKARDDEMRQRIEEHKKARPPGWRTVEAPLGVGRAIQREIGDAQVVVLDCLTLLASNIVERCGDDPERVNARVAEEKLVAEINELVQCMNSTDASFVLVSNEVGMGLVPENALGRMYRDLLGRANQTLARSADRVYLMVAGLPLAVKGGASPADECATAEDPGRPSSSSGL